MGFRFRKSKSVGPFRLNMSKSGIGWSVGVPGLRYSQKAGGGSRVTASIPGTGISYVTDSKKPTRKRRERLDEPEQKLLDHAATPAKEQPGRSVGSGSSGNGGGKKPGHGCLWWIVAVLFWPFSLSIWFWRSNAVASKKLKAGILAAVWVLLLVSAGNDSSTTTALPTSSSAAPSSVVVSSEPATPEPEEEELSSGSDSGESLPASASSVASSKAQENTPASSVATAPTASSQNSPAESNPTENLSSSESASSVKETVSSTSSVSVAAPSTAVEAAPAPTSSGSAASSKAPVSSSAESESRTVVINPAETQQGVMVWITATGSKYHCKPNCGNTKNASEIPLDRARALGYEPCKRCY